MWFRSSKKGEGRRLEREGRVEGGERRRNKRE